MAYKVVIVQKKPTWPHTGYAKSFLIELMIS